MTRAEIHAGVCGLRTVVEARLVGEVCHVRIESECPGCRRLAEELVEVDPLREMSHSGLGPRALELARKHCRHSACPVGVGIVKAVEAEAGLALPADVTIRLSTETALPAGAMPSGAPGFSAGLAAEGAAGPALPPGAR
ncbi:MAG TPA: hypothetical protein VLH79_15990 [Chthonomonadales bacterium]|nr:hypothetical protein [Chthonomonadales bacterium]